MGRCISPLNNCKSTFDSDPIGLSIWLAERLNDCHLVYLHVMRDDFFQ